MAGTPPLAHVGSKKNPCGDIERCVVGHPTRCSQPLNSVRLMVSQPTLCKGWGLGPLCMLRACRAHSLRWLHFGTILYSYYTVLTGKITHPLCVDFSANFLQDPGGGTHTRKIAGLGRSCQDVSMDASSLSAFNFALSSLSTKPAWNFVRVLTYVRHPSSQQPARISLLHAAGVVVVVIYLFFHVLLALRVILKKKTTRAF